MNAVVYTGPGWSWCERVIVLLRENDYEVEEVPIMEGLETLKTLTEDTIRTIPQVTIEGEYIGGFAEVEARIKGIKSINKV